MKKLIIDTFGLLESQSRVEHLLDFYPYGLKGLIADYLVNCLSGPPQLHQLNEWDWDDHDEPFLDQFLVAYNESRKWVTDPEHLKEDQKVLLVFLMVGRTVRRMVESSEKELRQSVIDVHSMQWGHNYVLLEMRH